MHIEGTGDIEQNKKIKHDRLMDTAFELFSHKGIAATTIQEISAKANVGKGTFYSYFKDKADIRNHIIAHKSAEIFAKAKEAMEEAGTPDTLEDVILFMADNIIDQLAEDKMTLTFIAKNLSWGVFKNVLTNDTDTNGIDFGQIFNDAVEQSPVKYKNPLIMIYMVIELISGSCYSCILYNEPMPIEELKPYLFDSIRAIMHSQELQAG